VSQSPIAVVGAAETTRLGKIPELSQIGLHADAAFNALADAGLKPSDIDGVASAGEPPAAVAHYLGISPTWVDGTNVGGCSFMLHVRHAEAAIAAGLCRTVLVTHGQSGRSRVGAASVPASPGSLHGQFEAPFGAYAAPNLFTLPALRYLKTHRLDETALAMVAVRQREWASRNPRAMMRGLLSVEAVLASPMVAWPFRLLMCCPLTDGGGALVLTSADRARDLPQTPVYVLGTGESAEAPIVSQMADFTTSAAFRRSGREAFERAGITRADVDHLMIYDAFAHLPLFGLEDLGFCLPGEAAGFIAAGNTAPGGRLPLNTNGGGLSYTHTGMYGMFALQESVRQLRGTAAAQVPGARVSVCHGVGGMFAAAGTVIFGVGV
jgi:acetyl-CoA acetyltransferase